MKYKLLRLSLLGILAMLWGNVLADEVKLDFTDATEIQAMGFALPEAGKGTDITEPFTYKNITITPYKGTTPVRIWNSNGVYTLRYFKADSNGNKGGIEISVPEGNVISQIDITGNTQLRNTTCDSGTNNMSQDNKTLTWTPDEGSSVGSVLFENGGSNTTNVETITVTYEAGGQVDTRIATTVTVGADQTGTVGSNMNLPVAVVTGIDGAPVEGATVEWSSSNEKVAEVDGTVLKLMAAGEATITATFAGDNTYKGSKGSFKVNVSAVAIEEPFTSLKALQEAVTDTSTPVTIQFNNVCVTAVKGSNAYLADADGYGILAYQRDHGLEAGQVLNGTINADLVLYRGQTEITNFSAKGLTITTTELTPTVKTIDQITAANQSTLVTIKGVTFSDGKLSDGTNEITYYDNFSAGSLEEGATYDITGIVILYNTTLEIAPRTADDIVKTGEGEQPVDTRLDLTLSFPQESYEATMGETFTAPELSGKPADYDGMLTYSSSNGDVAAVSLEGEVTLVAPGTTTITAEAIVSNIYKDASACYRLTVKEATTPVEVGDLIYTKVTSADQLVDGGEYLIVYEAGNVAFNGALETLDAVSNTVAVTISNGKIAQAPAVDAATFTLAKNEAGTWTVKAANGAYIGVSSNSNGLKATADAATYTHDISFDEDGNAVIAAIFDGSTMTMRFNNASNQDRFRYYKSGQQPVQLYLKDTAGEPVEPEVWTWRDFAVQLTNADIFDTSVMNFGVKVAEDGSYTATTADDATANFVVNSVRFNDAQHGWVNCTFTMKVNGPVLIKLGDCQFGAQTGTITDAEGNVTELTKPAKQCWNSNTPDQNVVATYYRGLTPTTLTIKYDGYCPFIGATAVDPADLPAEVTKYTLTFDAANSGAQGVAPEAVTEDAGTEITIPANFTLYKEGQTLTGWNDAAGMTYAPGDKITLQSDMTLVPVFTANEVSLADRTEAVTVKWNFRRDQGAPAVGWERQEGLVWVAQANVNGKTIDVALPFSTIPGKFNNKNNTDWVQINNGTTFTIPSCKGATVSMEAYNDITTTTIDGQSDYTQGKTISYTIAGSAETVDVVIGDGSYYRYIQVVLPKVEQQQGGGETFDHVAGTINWPVGNEQQPVISNEIAGAISSASVGTGSELTIATAKYFDTNMVHYTPVNGNAGNVEGVMIEYRVKPAKGVTFQPTQVDYAAVKVGTDNATYSWSYTVDGQESTITTVDPKPNLLRNNGSNSVENGGTAKLMHTETFENVGECSEFTFRFYISACANNKNICIGNVTISGIVNGESVSVNMYDLATVAAPAEGGSINVYPVSDQYEEGSEVKLTATENFGYDFVNWTNAAGEVVSEEPVFTHTVNADETLTANFVAVETYELALTVDGTNDYMVKISPAPEMVEGKMMYEAGTAVQLQADQYEGLVTFTNWNDGETNSSKLISMTADTQITAFYAQADIIAGWDFYTAGSNGRKADFYAQDNDADALTLVNTETGETSGWLDKSTLGGGGYESFTGAAVNWRTGAQNGDVGNWHWQTKVNAEAFTDINVQFQMLYNYNAYQRYNAEYSVDGQQWTQLGTITMTGAKAAASFSQQLPDEANNQSELYIRMIADKASNVEGAPSANDGNTLAMFFITGTPKLVDDGTAPVLVSSVPADGATGASASGKIVLTFDERVKLADTFMPTATLGSQTLTPAVSGKTVTFEYKGLEYSTEYTFTLPGGSIADLTNNFIVDPITLSFTTMVRPSVQKGLYDYVVENVEGLLAAISEAAARNDQNTRYRIFIKNGSYTIPVQSNKLVAKAEGYEVPECITFLNASNVSFIGESRDGVIITNGIDKNATFAGQYGTTSKYDGIGNSDVFQIGNRVSGLYWQDLTVETGMDDATGRDLAIQDRGTKNIYKNVGLRGYQDTWTSNNDNGLYYFEDGYVRGRTDYMCGKGDIFWNRVELRQIAGGYAAVPSKPAKYGWVYKDCVINGEDATVNYATGETRTAAQVDGNYTLGRPWGSGTPIALFIDTKMNVVPSAIGWNEMGSGWPARFAEYNSMTSTGSVIDLSGRKKTFGDGHANNPVLTAEEALENSDLHRMYGDWDPTLATEQAPLPSNVVVNKDTKVLSWADSDYALLYAIVKDGKVVDFTIENTYTVDDISATWAVRAANEMGGLSDASEAVYTTNITEIANGEQAVPETIYNLGGVRVQKAQRGLYIINGKKVVVK